MLLLTACPVGTKIADIEKDPGKYASKDVTVAGRVTGKATGAVETLRENPLGQSIAEGATTLAKTAVSAGGRIARAGQAASEAFMAEPPGEAAPSGKGKATSMGVPPPPNTQQP